MLSIGSSLPRIEGLVICKCGWILFSLKQWNLLCCLCFIKKSTSLIHFWFNSSFIKNWGSFYNHCLSSKESATMINQERDEPFRPATSFIEPPLNRNNFNTALPMALESQYQEQTTRNTQPQALMNATSLSLDLFSLLSSETVWAL